jgi:hypothetical protein
MTCHLLCKISGGTEDCHTITGQRSSLSQQLTRTGYLTIDSLQHTDNDTLLLDLSLLLHVLLIWGRHFASSAEWSGLRETLR